MNSVSFRTSSIINTTILTPRGGTNRETRLPTKPKTTDRWRIAVCDSGDRCRDCGSYTSAAVSHSWDRSAEGFPGGCSSGRHRRGPTPTRGAGPATRWPRRRLRSSPTKPGRDTRGCSGPGGHRFALRRIRATVSYWCPAGPRPDTCCCSRSSGCASTLLNRNRDRVS